MLTLYINVIRTTGKRVASSWIAALSLIVYWLISIPAGMIAGGLGPMIGGFFLGLVLAACLSSYLELISQAVSGSRFRLTLDEFKQSFFARFWDVISVMFAFWILQLVVGMLAQGDHRLAVLAIFGFAVAVFCNAVPEILYQGEARSFAVLIESGRFVTAHPVAWFLPNLLFAVGALAATGGLHVSHPAQYLLLFGNLFSSWAGVASLFADLPYWAIPIALFALHFVMLFRGVLFHELSTGGDNPRLRAFRAQMRG